MESIAITVTQASNPRRIACKGVRQSQVAAYIEVSTAAVSRWATGKSRPDPEYCRRLAVYFGEPLQKVYRPLRNSTGKKKPRL
jgi:transcriptional regulator with XRE-family HTH domain